MRSLDQTHSEQGTNASSGKGYGKALFTATTGQTTSTIAHGLGTTPSFIQIIPASAAAWTGFVASIAAGGY